MRPRLARTTLLITAASLIVTALVSAAPPSLSAVRPRSSRSMALPALAAGSEGPCPGPFPPDWHQCGPGAGETCGPDFGADHCQFHIRDARYGRRSVLRPPSPRFGPRPPHPLRCLTSAPHPLPAPHTPSQLRHRRPKRAFLRRNPRHVSHVLPILPRPAVRSNGPSLRPVNGSVGPCSVEGSGHLEAPPRRHLEQPQLRWFGRVDRVGHHS